MDLSDRKKKILAAVVERYIATGEPVGSKVLCGSLNVSSATIRNEMSDLSENGYLEQPHTSAGRIPSMKGYRYYISNLMSRYEISDADRFSIQSRFDNSVGEPKEILSQAALALSDVTGCAAVASTPYDSEATIKRVELIPLSAGTAFVVLLASTGMIKTRICRCDDGFDMKTAELFYNISEAYFVGRRASDITIAGIQTLAVSLGEKALIMTPLLSAIADLAVEATKSDVIIEGQSKLLGFKELENNAYGILEMLKHTSVIAKLLNSGREKLNISIGRENFNSVFEDSSMIFSKYAVGGRDVGSIGIIGPTRLDYARVIPNISFMCEEVGRILSETIDE